MSSDLADTASDSARDGARRAADLLAARHGDALTRARDVLRRRWLACLITLLYVYSFPYWKGIRSANELPRIYLTMALVDRGAVDITDELRRFQGTPDTSSYKGKLYCNKAPGMSLLTVPVYVAQKAANGWTTPELRHMFFWFRLFGATLPSLLFLLLLWRFLGELVPDMTSRQLLLAAYALGTMALVYGTLLMAHQLSGLLSASGFILLFLYSRGRGREHYPLLAGLAAGAAVLVDYQTAFIGPPLFIYAVARCPRRLRTAMHFSLGAALPLSLLLLYHWACFDSPFRTGYDYPTNPIFKRWHSQGFLGLKEFKLKQLGRRFFSPDDGLFYYSPFLLLALPGVVMMVRDRRYRAEGLLCGFVIAFFAYFISSVVFISGWDVGPRYITCSLPFYIVPIGYLLARVSCRPLRWRVLPYGLMVASIIIYASVNAVFPHYPDNFKQPLFDVTWRFGAAGYLPYNLGWLFGLEGVASVLPYLLLLAALVVALLWTGRGRRLPRLVTSLGALAVVVSLLGGYWYGLAFRSKPPPYYFMPWMERMWEPRHSAMSLDKLRRPIGPSGAVTPPPGVRRGGRRR